LVPLTAFVYYLLSNCFIINQIIEVDAISIIVRVPLSQFYVQFHLTHLEADSLRSKLIGIIIEVRGSQLPFPVSFGSSRRKVVRLRKL